MKGDKHEKSKEGQMGFTKVEDRFFAGCGRLKKVINTPNVVELGKECFQLCVELEKVIFKEWDKELRLIRISEGCFYGCKALKEITIPDTIQKLDVGCFNGCKKLAKVVFSKNLSEIANAVFFKLWKFARDNTSVNN